MAEPLPPQKLQIMRALTALIEDINPMNEDPHTGDAYTLDLRGKVLRGKGVVGAEVPRPWLALMEARVPEDGQFVGDRTRKLVPWDILVQGFAVNDLVHPSDPAYWLEAAVLQRLSRVVETNDSNGEPVFPDDYLLGRRIKSMKIGFGVVRPPDTISSTAYFYIPLSIELITNAARPYQGPK